MIVAIELVPDEQQLNIFTLLSRFISINPSQINLHILHVFLAKDKYWKCPILRGITLSYCNLNDPMDLDKHNWLGSE